jgi:hypothetical protein
MPGATVGISKPGQLGAIMVEAREAWKRIGYRDNLQGP